MNILKDTIIMTEEPASNLTHEYAKEMLHVAIKESEIANLYANVSNKAQWIEDEEYDYEAGTAAYQAAKEYSNKWFAVEGNLREKILQILSEEGVIIPITRQIEILRPFMDIMRTQVKDCVA